MSHHYSGPDFGFPHGDARLDFTDLYAFPKPEDAGKSILIINVHPSTAENPPEATTTESFAPDALYERATGMGSELALACDMRFASREKAILSQFEVGAGLVPGGGSMARLSRLMGRGRALEVVLGADDIPGDFAELFGYVNRSLPDAGLDGFVDALATRIASFDKLTIADTKRLVNVASLPADIEIKSGWDAWLASMARPATQKRIKELIGRGFSKPGDAENRLGDFIGQHGAGFYE